ncbi:hypothetical protein WJX84_010009 [Apatococcus fuscideae]|uniref:Uncharacterized protein n=1 Tax=Apatococcus fuscideae TaxID=2026836 RepID=A0AAW1SYR3_9CHLO
MIRRCALSGSGFVFGGFVFPFVVCCWVRLCGSGIFVFAAFGGIAGWLRLLDLRSGKRGRPFGGLGHPRTPRRPPQRPGPRQHPPHTTPPSNHDLPKPTPDDPPPSALRPGAREGVGKRGFGRASRGVSPPGTSPRPQLLTSSRTQGATTNAAVLQAAGPGLHGCPAVKKQATATARKQLRWS